LDHPTWSSVQGQDNSHDMNEKIMIVEDQFIEANNLKLILQKAGHAVCPIARSVPLALQIIEKEDPTLVLLDIFLKGSLTGIDLAKILIEKNIAFVYLSANSNKQTLDAAKATQPYGFLVKPFREKDVLVMLDIAQYLHRNSFRRPVYPKSLTEPLAVATNGNIDFTSNTRTQTAGGNFNIIGGSKALLNILSKVDMVAPSDTSVLILGESGTGKEKIADYIHQHSTRKNKPLIKVNCAALPATLIESELCGHERGAFTNAFEKRIGKFEQASNGTIFLDEIGEIPHDVQVKLLRVLQEKEIQRVGGNQTIKINVRIVAATNKDLEEEVAEKRFRIDLYYRLNVFPITLPPLRDRIEDIPELVHHFIKKYTAENSKDITGISDAMLQAMKNYKWPGNIRELMHFIERAVLITQGNIIDDPSLIKDFYRTPFTSGKKIDDPIKTMDDNERDNIIAALKKCNGKVFGDDGAAALLGVAVSTLNSRIKKLGIGKERVFYK